MIQPPRTALHAIRLLRGLTQTQLAAAIGAPQSAISLLETGARLPDPDLTDAISVALDVPVGLLGAPGPAARIGHLIQASIPRTTVNRTLATFTMTHIHLELLLGSRSARIVRGPSRASLTHAYDLADLMRRQWRLPAGPVAGLIPLVEAHGIVCIYRDLRPLRVHAVASTSASGQTVLFLDMHATRTEVTSAIAHELAHLVFGADPSKDQEEAADAFAAAFLLPADDVRDDAALHYGLGLPARAAEWGVQPRALVQRMRQLRVITARQSRELIHQALSLAGAEARTPALGSPNIIAEAVRNQGGSVKAASRALLTTEELRTAYLSRSGR